MLTGAPSADRRPAIDGELRLEVDRGYDRPVRVRIQQGFDEDGRSFRGAQLRYALGPLRTDLGGYAYGVDARFDPPLSGSRIDVRAPEADSDWFVVDLPSWPEDRALVVRFDPGSDPGQPVLPAVPAVPIELDLFAVLDDGLQFDGSVPLRLAPTAADWLRAFAPAVTRPGQPFELTVSRMGGWSGPRASSAVALQNPATTWRMVAADHQWTHDAPASDPSSDPVATRLRCPGLEPGLWRIAVEDTSAGLRGLSNPIWVDAEAPLRAFGSLHNHTTMGGHATSTPRRAMRYAREIARLDFAGLTEHSEAPDFDWEWLTAIEAELNDPPHFLCFVGFEWTHPTAGHRHVVARRADAITPLAADRTVRDGRAALAELAEAVGHDPNALIIAHHSLWRGGAAQRSYVFGQPEELPRQLAAEVYSWHGSSFRHGSRFPIHDTERHQLPVEMATDIWSVLRSGRRLWLTADGDDHLGRPGSLVAVRWDRARRYAYHGLTVADLPSLNKDAVFSAFERGDVYGTTGARLHLAVERDSHAVTVQVHATAPLRRCRVTTLAQTVAEWTFEVEEPDAGIPGAPLFLDPAKGTWSLERRLEVAGDQWLVLRVLQQDAHEAWKLIPPKTDFTPR